MGIETCEEKNVAKCQSHSKFFFPGVVNKTTAAIFRFLKVTAVGDRSWAPCDT